MNRKSFVLGVCLIPVLFVAVEKLGGKRKHPAAEGPDTPPGDSHGVEGA